MNAADAIAGGDVSKFIQAYDELVVQPLLANPGMLNKYGQ